MPLATFTWVSKLQTDAMVIQMLAYLFTKLALLLLFLRFFSAKAAFKWAILVACAVFTAAYVSFAAIFIFVTEDYVLLLRTTYGMGWFNVVTDVYLWALPLAAVGGLTMQWRRKAGVAALFSIGAL